MTGRAPDWDDFATDYERVHEPLTGRFARKALDAVPVGPGQQVLDVAAGPGVLALQAAAAGAKVLAADIAPAMIHRLEQRARAQGVATIEGRVMDASALDLPAASFDAVFCIFGIMLLADPGVGLARMAAVLKPGGRAAIVMWTGLERMEHVRRWQEAVREAFPEYASPPPPPGFARLQDAGSLASMMRDAGFAEVTVETVKCDWEVPSPAWFAAHAHLSPAAGSLYQALGPGTQAKVATVLERQLDARYGAGNPFHLSAEANVAVGRR